MLTSTIDQAQYRSVMGHLPTGVVALSGITAGAEYPCGLVVGTFQSLSLDPPLVSFSVAHTSTSWPKVRAAGRLCASVLAAGQEPVCRALSGKQPNKFADLDWSLSDAGSPASPRRTRSSTARSPTNSTAATTSSSSPGSCRWTPATANPSSSTRADSAASASSPPPETHSHDSTSKAARRVVVPRRSRSESRRIHTADGGRAKEGRGCHERADGGRTDDGRGGRAGRDRQQVGDQSCSPAARARSAAQVGHDCEHPRQSGRNFTPHRIPLAVQPRTDRSRGPGRQQLHPRLGDGPTRSPRRPLRRPGGPCAALASRAGRHIQRDRLPGGAESPGRARPHRRGRRFPRRGHQLPDVGSHDRHPVSASCQLQRQSPPSRLADWPKVVDRLPEHLDGYTAQTITDRTVLLAELDRVRENGFGLIDNELEEELVSLSCPVRDPAGNLVAIVSLNGPRYRFGRERIPDGLHEMQKIVDRLVEVFWRHSAGE